MASGEEIGPPGVVAARGEAGLLLEYLQTHDAFCPLCNYNLRQLLSPRCPECGRALQLTVGLTEPFLLPWILATTFTAMAASIGVLFFAALAALGAPLGLIRMIPPAAIPAFLGIFYGVAAIPLTIGLIQHRRRFWKLTRSTQYGLAGASFAINAILLGLNVCMML